MRHILDSFRFKHDGTTSRMQYVTVVDTWGACGARERCLGMLYRGMQRNTNSCTDRETEALLDQLVATCTPVLRKTAGLECSLCRTGFYILSSLGIKSKPSSHTRASYKSQAGPPSNCGVAVSADVTHDGYERHRAYLSVQTSTDEPSYIPLHARTLRGAALLS